MAQNAEEREQYNVASDRAISEAAIADRLSEIKAAARNSPAMEPNNLETTVTGDEGADLAEKKNTDKGTAGEQIKEMAKGAALDLAKKELKKKIWFYVAGWIGSVLVSTAWIWLPLMIILMICGATYMYWQKNWYNPSTYYYYFTNQPEKLLMDAITDTANSDYSGGSKAEDSSAKSATVNSAAGQSATGAQTPDKQSLDKNND